MLHSGTLDGMQQNCWLMIWEFQIWYKQVPTWLNVLIYNILSNLSVEPFLNKVLLEES